MFERVPQPSYEMRNPFIVLRFVLFAILVYVNLLTVGFAAWNLSVLKSLDGQPLGAPTFVVFNACLLLALLVLCLASSWYSSAAFDKVCYECGWTGFWSALQLASSIDITVSGPPSLCQGISITACASSSLTVALSWISSTMLLLYSFSLLTTAITHMNVIPDVWASSVRSVPWFVAPSTSLESRMPSEKSVPHLDVDIKRSSLHMPTPIFEQYAKALPLSPKTPNSPATPPIWQGRRSSVPSVDMPPPRRTTWTNRVFSGASSLAHQRSTESLRPSWAKRQGTGRRGVDHPFAMPRPAPKPVALHPIRPLRTLKLKSCWSPSTASARSAPHPPSVPPKARVAGTGAGPARSSATALSPTSTFYIDLERDAVVPVGGAPYRPVSYGMFPEDVVDPDMPVTHSLRTEWVRADSVASSH